MNVDFALTDNQVKKDVGFRCSFYKPSRQAGREHVNLVFGLSN